ncbi:SCO family protein [Mesobacillus maritimus]|uniref:SCO family protein n=1 Tax=Mesobacillus maritimus TaxID=1643336 RepID=UPI00203ACFE7|nr:SCO family protein [Mesobacillus maritimus]MCM3588094.1 SCO family protein [Mesobacillus maritimus]MCM3668425.1 SCO family protein [Mesobacillus maritimus]
MKKIYIICGLIVIIGISVGISFFLIRDASAQIPKDITLITQDKEDYEFGTAKETLKLVEFVYTHCPDVCPTTTQKMKLLKEDLKFEGVFGDKVQFLTVTIDPARDTPEVMQNYMKMFEIEEDGNWIMLTGDPSNLKEDQAKIRELADTFQFQYRDPGNGFFVHTTYTYLVDDDNKYIKKFPMGEDFNKDEVFKKIMEEL